MIEMIFKIPVENVLIFGAIEMIHTWIGITL